MHPILIVDDEKDNLDALTRLLRTHFQVTTTTSPFEALKHVQKSTFHVIVSDQRMPEMTGVEFFEKARAIAPNTTRVLLTGYTDIDSVIQAINRGHIYRYIAKPWDPNELQGILKQADEAFLIRRELEVKNAELKKAYEDLQVLDRAKGRFLTLITHELNTPLTVLNSFIQLLVQSKAPVSADFQKAISRISGASERFSQIIDEVLTYVRLESEHELDMQDSAVAPMAEEATRHLVDVAQVKHVTFDRKNREAGKAALDKETMRVALRKFFEDAIHRSPENSKIEWEVRISDKWVDIVVARGGEVMSEEAFQVFASSKNEMHHHRNLGLGLASARVIAQRHGGALVLLSSTTHRTEIAFRLPKK